MGNSFSSTSAVAAFIVSPLESATMPTLKTMFELLFTVTVLDETGMYQAGPNQSGRVRSLLGHGTTAGNADVAYSRVLEVTDDATPLVLNMTDGTMLQPDSRPAIFAKVTQLCFRNLSNWVMHIGGGTNDPDWLPDTPVMPGETLARSLTSASAHVVTAVTANTITISADDGTAIQCELTVVGRSA
jgi:hypothetical protein